MEQTQEVLNYVKECSMSEMYDIFDVCRERHNNKMMEGRN